MWQLQDAIKTAGGAELLAAAAQLPTTAATANGEAPGTNGKKKKKNKRTAAEAAGDAADATVGTNTSDPHTLLSL